jgi:hypothetical protein
VSDFPRAWIFTQWTAGASVTPSITVPAVAGVAHVLDSLDATLIATTVTGSYTVAVSSSDGALASIAVGAMAALVANTTAEVSRSGLDMAGGPGASLTVFLSAGVGGGNSAMLVIQGHDI